MPLGDVPQFPLHKLDQMFDDRDPDVRVLYKYRSCKPANLDLLRTDCVWFSTQRELNDPFDGLLRLPTSISQIDLDEVCVSLATAKPYDLTIQDARRVADYVGAGESLAALAPLGLMASQLHHAPLLRHIQHIEVDNEAWVRQLIVMAREVVECFLKDATVFCVSEHNDHPLMWAHYAASHAGFCAGYVCPVGIRNPQIIHRVSYVASPPAITCWQMVDDPGSVYRDLLLTKSAPWAYESEWRITFGALSGLVDRLLPYREIILGARISAEDETQVRSAVGGRRVSFYRAVLDSSAGEFAIRVVPA